jgi:hypothetical protein
VRAHRRIAAGVHEDDAGVRARRRGVGEHGAGHVGVAARFEHEAAADVVGAAAQPVALGGNGLAGRVGGAVDDEAERLAADMGVDRPDQVGHGQTTLPYREPVVLDSVHSRI